MIFVKKRNIEPLHLVNLHKSLAMKLKPILFLFAFILIGSFAFAQQKDLSPLIIGDKNQKHLLVLTNGDQLYGTLIEMDEASILFEFHGNTVEYNIKSIEQIYLVVTNKRFAVFHKTKSFGTERFAFSETAYSLKKKQAEYKTLYGLLHTIDVGLTDNISAGVGVVVPVGLVGRIKLTGQVNEKLRVGAGLQTMLSFIFDPFVLFYPYATASIGTPRKFLNINAGVMIQSEYPEDKLGVFSIGAGIKFKNNWRFVTDNYILLADGDGVIIPTAGMTWSKKKNRIEFGLSLPIVIFYGEAFPLPYIAYARRF